MKPSRSSGCLILKDHPTQWDKSTTTKRACSSFPHVRIVKSWHHDSNARRRRICKRLRSGNGAVEPRTGVRFFSRAGPSPPGTKENPRQTGEKAASEVDDSLGFLLAALSGLLLLLTRLLAAATLLTTLLLSRLLLPAAALLATLTALAALLTTLARILIWHDVYVSFFGKFPQFDNSVCASTF